jgi:2-polyprenyl-6-methoxyphenol hydroxylase-like FAD-dependent oxidoreductase
MAGIKILISGGGVAGNALAFWLSKLGHNVTVVERFPSLRATGLQVDLRGHGIEVVKRMGLEPAVRAKLAREDGLQFVDKSGKRRAYFPANKSGKGAQSFTSEYEIMRGDLCNVLYDGTKDRVKYIFGTSIESFEENENSVDVRFADGTTDQFDLLVGADGQGSRTRKMMLGPDAQDPFKPIGYAIAYFMLPRPIQEGDEYIATMHMIPRGRMLMTRRNNTHEIQVYLGCKTDSELFKKARRGDVESEKKAFAEIYQGGGWQADEIVSSLDDAKDFYCERMGLVKLESWFKGRVALVGDAAYCPSANTGMGITCSLVGAYILAGEIGRSLETDAGAKNEAKDITAALTAYEQKFQPFVNKIQEGVSERDGWGRISESPFGIAVLNGLLGLASLFKVNLGRFIREDIKGWDLPEYEELKPESTSTTDS